MELSVYFLFIFLLGLMISIVYFSIKTGISPTILHPNHAKYVAEKISKIAQNRVLDAGSGWGTSAFIIAKESPQKEVIGIECSWVPYLFSKLLEKFNNHNNLHFIKGDFRSYLWKKEDIVVAYLHPRGMIELEESFKKSSYPKTLFSFSFALHSHKPKTTQILKSWWPMPLYMYRFGLHVKV